jgi:large conductance mechanosensitive channel
MDRPYRAGSIWIALFTRALPWPVVDEPFRLAKDSKEGGFMKVLQEFKQFAVRGNVVDMAVGIVIGVAFGKIVSSLVGDVVMPAAGVLLGGVDFTDLNILLKEAVGDAPEVVLGYGKFLQAIVDFVIVAFAVFVLVKAINTLKRKEEAKPAPVPEPTPEVRILAEIRDILKQKA